MIQVMPVSSTPVTSMDYDIPVRVPPEEGEQLQALAAAQGLTVEAYLAQQVGPVVEQTINGLIGGGN